MDAFKQEEELMYNETVFCVKPENNYILKLFYETFLFTSHTGAIYFTIQNEYFAL